MFHPQTFLQVCMAMQMGAQVRFVEEMGRVVLKNNKSYRRNSITGLITKIQKRDEIGRVWIVTVAIPYEGKMGGEEEDIEFREK